MPQDKKVETPMDLKDLPEHLKELRERYEEIDDETEALEMQTSGCLVSLGQIICGNEDQEKSGLESETTATTK